MFPLFFIFSRPLFVVGRKEISKFLPIVFPFYDFQISLSIFKLVEAIIFSPNFPFSMSTFPTEWNHMFRILLFILDMRPYKEFLLLSNFFFLLFIFLICLHFIYISNMFPSVIRQSCPFQFSFSMVVCSGNATSS